MWVTEQKPLDPRTYTYETSEPAEIVSEMRPAGLDPGLRRSFQCSGLALASFVKLRPFPPLTDARSFS